MAFNNVTSPGSSSSRSDHTSRGSQRTYSNYPSPLSSNPTPHVGTHSGILHSAPEPGHNRQTATNIQSKENTSVSYHGQSGDNKPETGVSIGKDKEQRVALACLRCRVKRARCSGEKPQCKSCELANAECQW